MRKLALFLTLMSILPITFAESKTTQSIEYDHTSLYPYQSLIRIPTSSPGIFLRVYTYLNDITDPKDPSGVLTYVIHVEGTTGPPGAFLISNGIMNVGLNMVTTSGLSLIVPAGASGTITITVPDGSYFSY